MRNLFLVLLAGLIAFSQIITNRKSTEGRGLPTVYWVSDASKYRQGQYERFLAWKKEVGAPPFEFRIDPANNALSKVIVQGVAGTSGDIIQLFSAQVRYLAEIGILEDLTPWALEFGIDTNDLFPGYRWMMHEGKVMALPANSGSSGPYCVNVASFEKVGMPVPSGRWSFAEFERMGREYVRRANEGNPKPRRFFALAVNPSVMANSVGISQFNETLTAPAFNTPANAALLKLQRKWIYEDRILPSQADRDSFNQEGDNYGGSSALLHRGYFAMMNIGRWHFCTTRFISNQAQVPYACVPHPDGGFPNAIAGGKFNALYKGSQHKDLAKWFFKWLASDDYNRKIIDDADGEPPDMKWLKTEAYLHPAQYSNEWKFNEELSKLILTTAVPDESTPFAIPGIYGPKVNKLRDAFISGVISAEACLAEQEGVVGDAIKTHLSRRADLRERYQKALEVQKNIDALKASGKKIPLALVENPFLKIYYAKTGQGTP